MKKIVEFKPGSVVLHFSKSDSRQSIIDALGEPEGTTDQRREPIVCKYGNIYFTLIKNYICGIGIDLSADADAIWCNVDLSDVEGLRGLSMNEAADFFFGKSLGVVVVRDNQLAINERPEFFISFDDDGIVDRVGIKSY